MTPQMMFEAILPHHPKPAITLEAVKNPHCLKKFNPADGFCKTQINLDNLFILNSIKYLNTYLTFSTYLILDCYKKLQHSCNFV